MGRKNVVKSHSMFDAVDISTNQTSESTNVLNLDKASIQVNWSGTSPVGVLEIEATNQDPENSSSVWRSLDLGAVVNISGNTGEHDIILNEIPFWAIRLKYTSTSGTGSLNATLTMKVVGA